MIGVIGVIGVIGRALKGFSFANSEAYHGARKLGSLEALGSLGVRRRFLPLVPLVSLVPSNSQLSTLNYSLLTTLYSLLTTH